MGIVEYCDNVNCSLNSEYHCKSPEVDFDENASCLSVRYNNGEGAPAEQQSSTSEPELHDPNVTRQPKDKWIKYI